MAAPSMAPTLAQQYDANKNYKFYTYRVKLLLLIIKNNRKYIDSISNEKIATRKLELTFKFLKSKCVYREIC